MPRLSFGLASLWGGLTVLSLCGSASAQWFPGSGGRSCGCSAPSYMGPPPIMRQTAAAFGAAPMMPSSYAYNDAVECGAPIACHIEQPMQVVHVQAVAPVTQTVVAVQQMQPVHQAIMQDVPVTEYRPVKRTVSKPVYTTDYVDQAVTEMRPVSELRTVNVPTVDYQTVTEYKTVKKNVGYWVTKNIPNTRVAPWQYDNRPNALGAMNRAGYTMRTAFTPPHQQVRQYVPQTMTCTVPCSRKVAVPGMKQVTYNISRMQPTQTTRKVAVNRVTYQTAEVTVMAPVQVVKTMQVGTRVSYAPLGSTAIGSVPGSGGTALKPTPDTNNSAAQPRPTQTATPNSDLDPGAFDKRSSSIETYDSYGQRLSDTSETFKKTSVPSVVRVSQWVARTPSPSVPQPGGKSAAISIADTAR